MANSANISFAEGDESEWEFMEDMYKNGPFRSRSHVVVHAISKLMEEYDEDETLV